MVGPLKKENNKNNAPDLMSSCTPCCECLLSRDTEKMIKAMPDPWNSLVEVDEQLDWPNSQTLMELCHACAT